MKTRRMLYLAILAGLLVTMSALPALAVDDIPMYVHQSRVAYTGRSSGGPDDIVGYVHIQDVNLAKVEGAMVLAVWTLPDDSLYTPEGVETNSHGLAVFDDLWEGFGEYTLCVTGVTKAGWEYDESLNWEGQTCATLVMPPQYQPGK